MLDGLYGGSLSNNFGELPSHRQLAFYYAIALKEIARITTAYDHIEVTYDELVDQSEITFQKILNYFRKPLNPQMRQTLNARLSQTKGAGTHSTYLKREDSIPFTQILTSEVEADMRAIFSDFGVHLDTPRTLFKMRDPNNQLKIKNRERVKIANSDRMNESIQRKNETVQVKLDDGPIFVAKTVTTNVQYARFLQSLIKHHVPLEINGKSLFYHRLQPGISLVDGAILIEKILKPSCHFY